VLNRKEKLTEESLLHFLVEVCERHANTFFDVPSATNMRRKQKKGEKS
jgi:hypothetical protein